MNERFTREKIGEEIYFSAINIEKFNTSRISVNLVVNLERETVTANSLVAFLLRKGCGLYPDFTALNLRLDELYGAVISTDVRKFGDSQIINISGVCINDRFSLDNEKILPELAKLICNIITDPVMKNGLFLENEIEVEKNVLCDTIRSIKDDKSAYVVEKLIANMCADEPFGIAKYGYCEDMDKLSAEYVTKCYRDILSNSRIEIVCSGENIDNSLKDVFASKLSALERKNVTIKETKVTKPQTEYKEFVEKLNISQSKVALGFACGIPIADKKSTALRLMSALYGGSVSSKLFMNVREKMSLCYYCASTIDRYKGVMIAYSGVEEKNRQKAIQEMLHQLDDIRNGNFTTEELEQARAALITSFESMNDSLYGLEAWYLGQMLCGINHTPQEEIKLIKEISSNDVVEAAKSMKLNAMYSIVEGGEGE